MILLPNWSSSGISFKKCFSSVMRRFDSLFLVALFPFLIFLPACDSGGSNGSGSNGSEPELSREDVTGTFRLVSVGDFDATESEYDLYYDGTTEETTLHTCTFDDTHIQERESIKSTEVNESGNLVQTSTIQNGKKDINDSAVHYSEDEGKEFIVEFSEIEEDRLVFETLDSPQSDMVGEINELESTSGVPTSDSECANREQFHN